MRKVITLIMTLITLSAFAEQAVWVNAKPNKIDKAVCYIQIAEVEDGTITRLETHKFRRSTYGGYPYSMLRAFALSRERCIVSEETTVRGDSKRCNGMYYIKDGTPETIYWY